VKKVNGVGDDAVPMAEVVMASPKSLQHQVVWAAIAETLLSSTDAVLKKTVVRDDGFYSPSPFAIVRIYTVRRRMEEREWHVLDWKQSLANSGKLKYVVTDTHKLFVGRDGRKKADCHIAKGRDVGKLAFQTPVLRLQPMYSRLKSLDL
jgi:hypothetical protein